MATGFFQRRAGPIGPEKQQQPEQIFAACGRDNFFGFLAFWLFGFLAFWLFGFLAFWLFGFLAFWLFGFCARSAPNLIWPAQPLGLFRPIRSSPTFGKANSIVWMTPNEWPGAWMPLGRVCSIGFGKRGSAGTRARGVRKGMPPLALGCRGGAPHQAASGGLSSGCKPQKAATQWQLNQPSGLAYTMQSQRADHNPPVRLAKSRQGHPGCASAELW